MPHQWERLKSRDKKSSRFDLCTVCGTVAEMLAPMRYRTPGKDWQDEMPPCKDDPPPSIEDRLSAIAAKLSPSGLRGFQQIAATVRALHRLLERQRINTDAAQARVEEFEAQIDQILKDALERLEEPK